MERAAVALEERDGVQLEDEKLSEVEDGQTFPVEKEGMGGERDADEADVLTKGASDCAWLGMVVPTSCDADAEEDVSVSKLPIPLSSSMTSP